MGEIREVRVPDIGDFSGVDVIEVLVAPGDRVELDDSLISLESDKATMEVPSPARGVVREITAEVGQKVSEGDPILTLELEEGAEGAAGEGPETRLPSPEAGGKEVPPEPEPAPAPPPPHAEEAVAGPPSEPFHAAHASPAIRRFARELGVELARVQGSGRKGRITREDVQHHVKRALSRPAAAGVPALPEMPEIDFARFGPVDEEPLSRIRKRAAQNLHRAWLHVPHVTQHDEADVTELESFRKAHAAEAESRGAKLTPVAFLIRASVAALKAFPRFNSSLAPGGESLVLKRYYHIGVAVDTADGLVVPVLRDADRKGLLDLAAELAELSSRAREGKLRPEDLQGATFSISSLGGIGGTAFTPIVNAPEVAILGVSRHTWKPVYRDGQFVPRLILPLSLSYDHRVIDGAAAARFTTYLSGVLSDLRKILL